jgi:hypothetical protein
LLQNFCILGQQFRHFLLCHGPLPMEQGFQNPSQSDLTAFVEGKFRICCWMLRKAGIRLVAVIPRFDRSEGIFHAVRFQD